MSSSGDRQIHVGRLRKSLEQFDHALRCRVAEELLEVLRGLKSDLRASGEKVGFVLRKR